MNILNDWLNSTLYVPDKRDAYTIFGGYEGIISKGYAHQDRLQAIENTGEAFIAGKKLGKERGKKKGYDEATIEAKKQFKEQKLIERQKGALEGFLSRDHLFLGRQGEIFSTNNLQKMFTYEPVVYSKGKRKQISTNEYKVFQDTFEKIIRKEVADNTSKIAALNKKEQEIEYKNRVKNKLFIFF